MGKISEALKKAAKTNPPRSAVREEKLKVPDPVPTEPQSKAQSARSIRVHVAEKVGLRPEKSAVQEEKADPIAKPSHFVEPVYTPQRLAAQSVDTAAPKKTDDVLPANRIQPTPAHENPHVMVVRPPLPDQPEPPISPSRIPQTKAGHNDPATAVKQSTRRPIQVSYSETQVQAMDPEQLKNNRIFSIFDEIEATNQIKILRTQVLKKLEAIGGNSILVTSANPHEGKTFTSINLGVSIAKEFSRTVLIVDADLRKPAKRHADFSTDFFSIDVEFGLTDYLKGEADMRDILINPGIDRLTLIPAGRPVDNAPELLNSSRMAEMMMDVKGRYGSERLVIVDGPAMLPFPDAMILAQYVDGVIPVVEMERTPADQLKRMMDILKEARILGTVLNKKQG
jgi:non-specific protein-tyrosine kinase